MESQSSPFYTKVCLEQSSWFKFLSQKNWALPRSRLLCQFLSTGIYIECKWLVKQKIMSSPVSRCFALNVLPCFLAMLNSSCLNYSDCVEHFLVMNNLAMRQSNITIMLEPHLCVCDFCLIFACTPISHHASIRICRCYSLNNEGIHCIQWTNCLQNRESKAGPWTTSCASWCCTRILPCAVIILRTIENSKPAHEQLEVDVAQESLLGPLLFCEP